MKKRIAALSMALVMALGAAAVAAGGEKSITVTPMDMTINGQAVTPTKSNGEAAEVFAYDGATYVPLRYLSELLGIEVEWDKNAPNTAKLVNVPGFEAPAAGLKDGTHTGEAEGFGGAVVAEVTVVGGKITGVKLTGDKETPAIGGAALEKLAEQVKAAGGAGIDGVSGATVTSKAVKKAVAAALGETYNEEAPKPVEPAAPAEIVKIEGGLQIGLAYGAAHGTKCFTQAHAVVKDDVIVAAHLDDYQFMAADTDVEFVPNSDKDFAAGYAEGKALASKRTMADYYSASMAAKAGSTVRIDDNWAAIEAYVVGKTIAEVEALAGRSDAVDAISGATLADTAGYLGVIAQAAKNAQQTQAVKYTGDSSKLKLNVAYGAAHGAKCFTAAAALTDGEKIILSCIDEFQFVAANSGAVLVPNSDKDFAAGYAEGQALASKRSMADYYSNNMAVKAGSTVRIDDNWNAIQNHINGMTIAEAKALAGQSNAVDAVSGATLADTAGYIGMVVSAAEG